MTHRQNLQARELLLFSLSLIYSNMIICLLNWHDERVEITREETRVYHERLCVIINFENPALARTCIASYRTFTSFLLFKF